MRHRAVFEKEFVNQIPLSDHGHKILSNNHITNLQEVLDKKHLLKNPSYDDLSVMKKYIESKYINAYRVKLSLDDKNLHATNLLSAIVKYVRLNKLKQNGCSNIVYTDSYIENLCVSLSPALGLFDWLISNKQEKNTAGKAFNKLEEIFSQYDVAEKNKSLIESKLNVDKEYGWDVFKKFPTNVLKVIEDVNPDVIAPDPKKINLIDLDSIIPVSNQQTKNTDKPNEDHHSNVDNCVVDVFKLLYLNKQGLTANNIAKQLELDKDTVNKALQEQQKAKEAESNKTLATYDDVMKLLINNPDGLTAVQITKELNTTIDFVDEILNNHSNRFYLDDNYLWKIKTKQDNTLKPEVVNNKLETTINKSTKPNESNLPENINLDCDKFVIIDTETNFDDKVFSVGVVVADAKTYELLNAEYYIITNNLNVPGVYTNSLWLKHDFETHQCLYNEAMNSIKRTLDSENINNIFAYNASFDYNHLPKLHDYYWFDIMKVAAYKQHNKHLPKDAEYCSTGRLKRGYTVEDILYYLSKKWKSETHNAVLDAVDELKIMDLLRLPINNYVDANITAQKKKISKHN